MRRRVAFAIYQVCLFDLLTKWSQSSEERRLSQAERRAQDRYVFTYVRTFLVSIFSQPSMAPSASHPVVLVTGASKGLGLCIASLLVKGTKTIPPSNVVTLSRSVPPALSALESETKAQATSLLVVQGDMTSQEDNARTVDAAIAKWGRLDGVVLNAGVIEFARIADVVRVLLDHLSCVLIPPLGPFIFCTPTQH